MSEDSMFSQTETNEVENPEQQLQLPQEIAELVGEGKKYKTAEDALKSIPHAQSHIHKLEEEMKAMREELAKRKAAEELLEELKSTGFQPKEIPKQEPVDIESVVATVLSKKEQQARILGNQAKVVNEFNAHYGEKGEESFNNLAKDLGMSVQDLNLLSARSPEAVFKLAGFSKKESLPGKTSSSVNTESMVSSSPNLSARLPKNATTKDLVQAWRNAGEMIKQS